MCVCCAECCSFVMSFFACFLLCNCFNLCVKLVDYNEISMDWSRWFDWLLIWQQAVSPYVAGENKCWLLCAELTCRQRECCDQFLTSTIESAVSPVNKNFVRGCCHECSQASNIIIVITMIMFMVLSSRPQSLQEFTRFIWWMQTERWVAANPQTKPTTWANSPPN